MLVACPVGQSQLDKCSINYYHVTRVHTELKCVKPAIIYATRRVGLSYFLIH